MILTAFALGGILYIINYFFVAKKKIEVQPFVLVACFALASAACFCFNYFVHPGLRGKDYSVFEMFQMGLAFAYFYTLIFFFVFANVAGFILKLETKKHLDILAPSIVLFGAVSKIGCHFTGCCHGITINGVEVPTVLIECGVMFVAFLVFQFFIKRNRMLNFVLFYSSFRFIIEFFRRSSGAVRLFDIFTPAHWLAFAVILVILINYKYFAMPEKISNSKEINNETT